MTFHQKLGILQNVLVKHVDLTELSPYFFVRVASFITRNIEPHNWNDLVDMILELPQVPVEEQRAWADEIMDFCKELDVNERPRISVAHSVTLKKILDIFDECQTRQVLAFADSEGSRQTEKSRQKLPLEIVQVPQVQDTSGAAKDFGYN